MIDELMYINDGINPFRRLVIGYGGLNYHPYLPIIGGMIGGMAYVDPDNPSELTDEHVLKYSEDPESGIKNLNDWLNAVINDEDEDVNKKIQELTRQYSDLIFEEKYNNEKGKYKDLKLDENIQSSKKIIEDYFNKISEDYIPEKELEGKFKQPEQNDLYERYDDDAKKIYPSNILDTSKNELRGDLSEQDAVDYEEDTRMLYNIDKDKSLAYNSKELEPYTDEFLNYALKKIGIEKTPNELNKYDKDKLRNLILQFMPIDIIKNKTIWELKSFSNPIQNYPLNNYQMGISKFDFNTIFKGSGNNIKKLFNVKFKYDKDNDGWKIKNLYVEKINNKGEPESMEKEIPILKGNNFKYYWLFNNKDGIGYYNPLINKKFKPIKSSNGYDFGWKDDLTLSNKIPINTKDLNIMPRRYSTKYNKIIKKYKK